VLKVAVYSCGRLEKTLGVSHPHMVPPWGFPVIEGFLMNRLRAIAAGSASRLAQVRSQVFATATLATRGGAAGLHITVQAPDAVAEVFVDQIGADVTPEAVARLR
jgi:hypothetical protein